MRRRRSSKGTHTPSNHSVLLDFKAKVTVSEAVIWKDTIRIVQFEELSAKRFAFGVDVAYAVRADAYNIYAQLRAERIPIYYVNEELTTHILEQLGARLRAKKLHLLDVEEIDNFVQGENIVDLRKTFLTFNAGRLLKIRAHKRKRIEEAEKLKSLNRNSAAANVLETEFALEEETVAEIIASMHQEKDI